VNLQQQQQQQQRQRQRQHALQHSTAADRVTLQTYWGKPTVVWLSGRCSLHWPGGGHHHATALLLAKGQHIVAEQLGQPMAACGPGWVNMSTKRMTGGRSSAGGRCVAPWLT
jgi:hypothetical protein